MRKSRFTEAQIVGILRELDAGTTATELGRKHGIHANTIRLWKDRYGGPDTSDLVRLKQLEDENKRKDRIIARLALEVDAYERAGRKKRLGPSQRQEAVRALQQRGISIVRACQLAGYNRSNLYYRRIGKADEAIKVRLHQFAQERPRWGWRRLFIVMRRREGYDVGETRFLRLYRELRLQVRPRKERKVNYVRGELLAPVTARNERWSIDFMHDRLANGRSFRALTIGDDFTRECLALQMAHSLGSADVIRTFDAIAFERGLPKTIRFDHGSEFTSHAMLRWAAEHRVQLHFIQPGKPTQNANAESLNGRIRDELLNLCSFTNIFEAREIGESWRCDYNENRPHSALDYRTPKEFAESLKINPPSQLSAA